MADFPHLQLPVKIEGVYRARGGGDGPGQKSIDNRSNRQSHGGYLKEKINSIRESWNIVRESKILGSSALPDDSDIPIFLRIDTNTFKLESLANWGIEIISEEDEGFIIGASTDELKQFEENVNQFLKDSGTYRHTASQIWEIVSDNSWRVNLLQGPLKSKWSTIDDDSLYTVEIGVTCTGINNKDFPQRHKFNTVERYDLKVLEYEELTKQLQLEREEKQIKREDDIEKYVKFYGGEIHDIWDNEVDALFFKLTINGKGLKDIILTYPYLFKAAFPPQFEIANVEGQQVSFDFAEIIPADENAPIVCIVDSGIQEEHPLISGAIVKGSSRSYVEGDTSTADWVKISGHGTSVAGAVLYPETIPLTGKYSLLTRIQNARILDRSNQISKEKFAPVLIDNLIDDYSETRIFNLSVADEFAHIGSHMPELAEAIDKGIDENEILFIISAGNISQEMILENSDNGAAYPDYLLESHSSIANPGVSYFALTVGSVGLIDFEDDDYTSMAGNQRVSPFSRTGFGMWGSIKPEVVEYGGDFLINRKDKKQLITRREVCPELVNSTLHQPLTFNKEKIGTSYCAPKVSYIASRLQAEHPEESCLMYKTLIVQSARLPNHCWEKPTTEDIRKYGYGIPNLDRALNNTPGRITFIQSGVISPKHADLYKIIIPEALIGEKDFVLLMEVSLCFTAETRITRQGAHRYVAGWAEWTTSQIGENFNSFRNRTLDYIDTESPEIDVNSAQPGHDTIKWVIQPNPKWSDVKLNRNNSATQKSWAIIRPHELSKDFSIAIIGHTGWDKSPDVYIDYALSISFEVLSGEISIYNIMAEAQIETEVESEIAV